MDIVVLVSGVADPRQSLPKDLSDATLQSHLIRHGTLSPFDEAALELALAARDADPACRVTALVAADETLTRKVAGWRPDAIHRLDLETVARWNADAVAHALASALRELAPLAALVLVGREFGDFDDGSIPSGLAAQLRRPYLSLSLVLRREAGGWSTLRQVAGGLERVQLAGPAVLSVTNDPGNRLRHPLMKNVMMARKASVPVWRAAAPVSGDALQLQAMSPAAEPPRRAACEWIEGSAEDKARALAQELLAVVRA